MPEYACTECGAAIGVDDEWESISNDDVLTCSGCGTAFNLDYEETYDEETGECECYFCLDKVGK